MRKFNKFNFNKDKKNRRNKKYNNKKNVSNNHNKYYNNHANNKISNNRNNKNENGKINNLNNKTINKIYKNFIPKNNKYVHKDKGNSQSNNNFHEYNICSLCGKKIIDDTTSFYIEEEKRYLCFDCAIKEIKMKFNISSKNKVIYLGSGTFGEIREVKSENTFVILRRIQFVKPKYEKFTSSYLQNTKIENYENKKSY